MMKFIIHIFFVSLLLAFVDGRTCKSTFGGTTICKNGVNYCMEVTYKFKGVEATLQGCSNQLSINIDGIPQSCSENGVRNLGAYDLTGQYYCCDSDLCNDKKLDANSATRPFFFGFSILPIILILINNAL